MKASSKSRSYRQNQDPGEEDKALTPVEAAPKTISIDKALHKKSKHTNNSNQKYTPKDTKHTAAYLQLQPQPPKAVATAEPRSIKRYTEVPITIRKALHKYH